MLSEIYVNILRCSISYMTQTIFRDMLRNGEGLYQLPVVKGISVVGDPIEPFFPRIKKQSIATKSFNNGSKHFLS